MELVSLGEVALTYTSLDSVDYGSDGQLYGTLDGRIDGDRLSAASGRQRQPSEPARNLDHRRSGDRLGRA
jgi:hypothetical protein